MATRRNWQTATPSKFEIQRKAIERAEKRRQARWTLNEAAPTDLPTLPYVPQIEPGPNSKYQMMSVE